MKALSRLLLLAMLVASLGLVGCSDDGDDGSNGAAGAPGAPGASAYEIAVANGFVGTVDEWLASLQATSPASTVPPVETCYMCHETGKIAAATAVHTATSGVGANVCTSCHGPNATFHAGVGLAPNCGGCHDGVGAPLFMTLIHGIHASEQVMPSGQYTVSGTTFKVTYPSYMNNCSVCHTTDLAAVAAVPVTYTVCMSCHENWTAFGTGILGGINHNGFVATTNCSACHEGTIAPATIAAFHNGLLTERSGLIWGGQDVSVVEGAKVNMQITGITRSGANLNVTWTAAYDGVPVNPCNTTVAAGAPIFHAGGAANSATGQAASNLSLLKGFGQGDDWVNDGAATSPGQANAVTLTTSNTTCAANVATSVIALPTAEQASSKNGRGVLALQGKAQVVPPGITDVNPNVAGNQNVIQVRSKTPTREYMVATGAAPTTLRRAIADTAGCLRCHVGSLYQHGGNRIDNVDMCVICHNEASSDQINRVGDGVTAAEAYDGQAGQTYGLKSFLHAVHSTGKTVNPSKITMIYRTMGIFVWAPEGVTPPNWPTVDVEGNPLTSGHAATVYGSNPAGTNPNGTTRVHNIYHPTYPRPLNECDACHVPGFAMVPDQAVSVATTTNTGTSFSGQLDDTLEGTGAAACTSCHQQVKAHAYQNGWTPAVFPEGRKTILDAAP
ncbi:MAG: hypothetical protein FIB02_06125 [Desulfuromonas sp.]|nr:hypothetical protein [Desulfuromonas sp.]